MGLPLKYRWLSAVASMITSNYGTVTPTRVFISKAPVLTRFAATTPTNVSQTLALNYPPNHNQDTLTMGDGQPSGLN